ncbi:hypothetical protein EVAR_80762_1 [Eumeta japonica]|uniref:Uncharacterized protein n=1 Tax=Eumeta variegata TaxID=151549 RepID=A0A4C1XAV8_EUMVA|nr:hypothetical protein EVAR_80762_1 [Eumeta japonica]
MHPIKKTTLVRDTSKALGVRAHILRRKVTQPAGGARPRPRVTQPPAGHVAGNAPLLIRERRRGGTLHENKRTRPVHCGRDARRRSGDGRSERFSYRRRC